MKEERILRAMTEIDEEYIRAYAPGREGTAPLRRGRPFRAAMIGVAAAALLVTAALALSPSMRERLESALGLFAPYAQEVEGVACTDQGVEVRAVSALADGNTVVIYFEARDLVGGRLNETTSTNTQPQWPEGTAWRQGRLLTAEQVAYDSETETVLFRTAFIGSGLPAEELTIQLYGQVFATRTGEVDEDGRPVREKIWGEWRLEVPIEGQAVTTISLEQSGTEAALAPRAIGLHISPISCTIECDPRDSRETLGYPLTLFGGEGEMVSGIPSDDCYYSGGYATNHWTFPRPIDPAAVTTIALGRWCIPLENGVAGQGYWLEETP